MLIGHINRSVQRKLTFAMTVLAGLSLLAGLISWISFSRTEQALETLQARSLSDIRQVMELANISTGLNGSAPALASAGNVVAVDAAWAELQHQLEDFTALTSNVSILSLPGGFLPTEVPAIVRLRDRLRNIVYNLYLTQKDRLIANEALYEERQRVAMMMDAAVKDDTTLPASIAILSQVFITTDLAQISKLENTYGALANTASGTAQDSRIFDMRRAVISADMRAHVLLAAITVSSSQLENTVRALADTLETSALDRSERMFAVIASGKFALIFGAGGCLLAALFVAHRMLADVVARLHNAAEAMTNLASGNGEASVPGIERPDEIGDLARAFRVFRAQAIERQELTSRLEQTSRILSGIFDNMADGLVLFMRDGSISIYNPRLIDLCRLDETQFVNQTGIGALFHAMRDAGGIFQIADASPVDFTQIFRHGNVDVPSGLECRFADSQVLSIKAGLMPDGSHLLGFSDITQQKNMEMQVRHASKMEALGQLTGGIAHDFNNFLAAISGNLQLIGEEASPGTPMRKRALRALDAVDSGAAMVTRLLAFARKQELAPVATDLNELVLDLADLVRLSIGPSILLETDLTANLPEVLVDAHQMQDAILNLVFNARDAISGSGTIRLITRPAVEGMISLMIEDNGIGMSADVLARVFEPFFSTRAFGGGNGLGMAMVYGFVHQAGASISVESEPGRGTTVRVELPVAGDGGAARRSNVAEPPQQVRIPVRRRERILVLEDDIRVQETAVELIESLGFSCVAVADIRSAVEVHRREPFDLLFADMVLANGEKGTDAARAIRDRQPDIAVLFCSGYAGELSVSEIDAYLPVLSKPYCRDALANMVEMALTQAETTASTSASKT